MAKLNRLAVAFLLIFIQACKKSEVILEDLSQRDANEVVVLLRTANINAEKMALKERKSTTYKIAVDGQKAQEALKILVENQLPREPNFGLKEVYPPGSAGIIPTKSDEKARLIMALQGEIEALIKLLPGVVDTRVVLAMDMNTSFSKELPKKSASVAIIYYPSKDSDDSLISDTEIKTLVSSSISDLLVDDIHVIQKPLKAISYVGINHISNIPTVQTMSQSNNTKNIVWASLCITAIALLSCAYIMARPYLQRRTNQRHNLARSSEA